MFFSSVVGPVGDLLIPGVGSVQISGLPYATVGASHYSIGACYTGVTGNNHVFVQTNPGATSLNLYQGVGTGITYAAVTGNYVLFTVVYRSS